jgi:hypothetical protein
MIGRVIRFANLSEQFHPIFTNKEAGRTEARPI